MTRSRDTLPPISDVLPTMDSVEYAMGTLDSDEHDLGDLIDDMLRQIGRDMQALKDRLSRG